MDRTEIINGPDADEGDLREMAPVHPHPPLRDPRAFCDSWLGNHSRRSGMAYWNQYWEARLIDSNPTSRDIAKLPELVAWFKPLLDVETSS